MDGKGVPILVDAVFMNGRQRRGDSDDDVGADEDPFVFDLLPGGSYGEFGLAARWCSCRSRNHGKTSASQWPGILQRKFGLKSTERVGFCRHNKDHGGVRGARGGPGSNTNHPHQDGQRQRESGVREGSMVQTLTPPTKTDREIGAADSKVRKGDKVTKPPPPPGWTETAGRH